MSTSQESASARPLRVGACLSLTGRFARFGIQAARGLEAWRVLAGGAELVIEDDGSDRRQLEGVLPSVARRCDVLLGPYSTLLARTAGRMAADAGWLLWNHGGSGDDVEAAHPSHVVSILTPTARYAEPFMRHLADGGHVRRLRIAHGKGSFGRQVADGAEVAARRLGIAGSRDPRGIMDAPWGLFCAGTFEEDVETVQRARDLLNPPAMVCAVAAGVREFGEAIGEAEGIFGVGQWFPGAYGTPSLGPSEEAFLTAYSALCPVVPDYPAVQAAAGAILATHCARLAGGTGRDLLWEVARTVSTRTLFGDFRISSDGAQVGHETVLVQWTAQGPTTA